VEKGIAATMAEMAHNAATMPLARRVIERVTRRSA